MGKAALRKRSAANRSQRDCLLPLRPSSATTSVTVVNMDPVMHDIQAYETSNLVRGSCSTCLCP